VFAERKFRWYYEGVGGWWEYDERTSVEIEKYQSRREGNLDSVPAAFELLIAGFIYIIDLENGVQYRRGFPTRRRRIKRDLAGIPDCKVGVTGIIIFIQLICKVEINSKSYNQYQQFFLLNQGDTVLISFKDDTYNAVLNNLGPVAAMPVKFVS